MAGKDDGGAARAPLSSLSENMCSPAGIWDCCGCRGVEQTRMMPSQPSQQGPRTNAPLSQNKQCGLGIVFECDVVADGQTILHINSLVPGGPAWESSNRGGLEVGDVLQSIDGRSVMGESLENLAPMLLGNEGTVVRLGVLRVVEGKRVALTFSITRKSFSPPKGVLTPDSSRPNNIKVMTSEKKKTSARGRNRSTGVGTGKENTFSPANAANAAVKSWQT